MIPETDWLGMEPRRWQAEALPIALAAARAAWKTKEWPIVVAATGAGKSYFQGQMLRASLPKAKAAGGVIVVLVPSEDLVVALSATLRLFLGRRAVGEYYGRRKQSGRDVIVCCNASIGSLSAMLQKKGRKVALLMVDEVHRSEAPTVIEGVQSLPHLGPDLARIGMTATPFRSLKDERISLFAEVVYTYGIGEAIDDGVLVPWRTVDTIEDTDLDTWCIEQILELARPLYVETCRETWEAYAPIVARMLPVRASRLLRDLSNAQQVGWDAYQSGIEPPATAPAPGWILAGAAGYRRHSPGVVNAGSIADATEFAALLSEAGVPAEPIHSNLSQEGRRILLEQLETGTLGALVHVALLQEGVDFPWLEWGCLRRPVKSPVRFLQELGRFLRVHPAKADAVIVDPNSLMSRHGLRATPRLGDGAALDQIVSTAVGEDTDEEMDSWRVDFPELADLPPITGIQSRRTVAVSSLESWILRLHESAQLAGLCVREGEWSDVGSAWRTRRITPDRIARLVKMRWACKFLRVEARESARWIIDSAESARGAVRGAPIIVTEGMGSDMLDVLYGIGRALREAKESSQGYGHATYRWPQHATHIPLPALPSAVREAVARSQESGDS